MLDLVKKGMLAGIGLALKTWDEVEAFARDLQKRGKMTEKEGRQFLDELQQRYQDVQSKLEKRVEDSVRNFLKKADVVTADQLKGLKKEIRELKQVVAGLSEKSD